MFHTSSSNRLITKHVLTTQITFFAEGTVGHSAPLPHPTKTPKPHVRDQSENKRKCRTLAVTRMQDTERLAGLGLGSDPETMGLPEVKCLLRRAPGPSHQDGDLLRAMVSLDKGA